ncbi:MAG: MBL fold metallo-hydrolase [Actinomycetota bacterium]
MLVRVWGCRGSLAAPGPDTVRYGGNTSCVEIRLDEDDTLIVLDAGTGIRPLGLSLERQPPKTVHLLMTHLHMDHLEGLGFFEPLWSRNVDFHIWGPRSSVRSLQSRIAKYLSPPLFPVSLSEIPSHPEFHDVPVEEWELAGAKIKAGPVKHPGPTVGYRIQHNGSALAYIPDHEPARGQRGVDFARAEPKWISGYDLASGVDVLLHDSQYTEEEYSARVGWGHSSIKHTAAFAQAAKAGRLVMFHHDPMHSDEELETMLDEVRGMWHGTGKEPVLAHEGMELPLP